MNKRDVPTGSVAPSDRMNPGDGGTDPSKSSSQKQDFHCEFPGCERTFPTKIGRSLHHVKAHRDWYDSKQNTRHKKMVWSEEEMKLMARQEAMFLRDNVKFINLALIEVFPERTQDAIKGKRRDPKYKEMVANCLEEMNNTSSESESESETPLNKEDSRHNLRLDIAKFLEAIPDLESRDFDADWLAKITQDVIDGAPTPQVYDDISLYTLRNFHYEKEHRRRRVFANPPTVNKRQARRAQYAKTQDLWRKNPSRCMQDILRVDGDTPNLPQDILVPFWNATMTSNNASSPNYPASNNVIESLWAPVNLGEIRRARPGGSTAPGPDGVTAKKWKGIPFPIVLRMLNIFMWCGKLPEHLLESRTTLIPKKQVPQTPADYRPITVSSVISRTLNKILANRMLSLVKLDERQKAFRNVDGCSENTFIVDLALRYHQTLHKPLYMASLDIAKAFDSVSHLALINTLRQKGVPDVAIEYIEHLYNNSKTRLTCDGWTSDLIHPKCGVKQGDPLSPIIFNCIIDEMIKQLPKDVGVKIQQQKLDVLAFADDLILMASTQKGLQLMIDSATEFLQKCGLLVNPNKCFTIALQTVPHEKKTIVKENVRFRCLGRNIVSLKRTDVWEYLGVSFNADGKTFQNVKIEIDSQLERITKAPLKPQQRLFGLRVFILPALYHRLILGNTRIGMLRRLDMRIRSAMRKWLSLPHDTPIAYFHADVKDGGLGIPSLRWFVPMLRLTRLRNLGKALRENVSSYIEDELCRVRRHLLDHGKQHEKLKDIRKRWSDNLYGAVDGKALEKSSRVPQQHRWIQDGTSFLSGSDFVRFIKLRINALPVRSRTSRGRIADRSCRAGCLNIETLNHVLQKCHRTHDCRLKRHDNIVSYLSRNLINQEYRVELEPHFESIQGLRKPDLIAIKEQTAIIIDAQVGSEQADLAKAHKAKIDKYAGLADAVKERFGVATTHFTSATLSWRGIWSEQSCNHLLGLHVLRRSELKNISTRVLRGGLMGFDHYMRRTGRSLERGRRRGRPPENQRRD